MSTQSVVDASTSGSSDVGACLAAMQKEIAALRFDLTEAQAQIFQQNQEKEAAIREFQFQFSVEIATTRRLRRRIARLKDTQKALMYVPFPHPCIDRSLTLVRRQRIEELEDVVLSSEPLFDRIRIFMPQHAEHVQYAQHTEHTSPDFKPQKSCAQARNAMADINDPSPTQGIPSMPSMSPPHKSRPLKREYAMADINVHCGSKSGSSDNDDAAATSSSTTESQHFDHSTGFSIPSTTSGRLSDYGGFASSARRASGNGSGRKRSRTDEDEDEYEDPGTASSARHDRGNDIGRKRSRIDEVDVEPTSSHPEPRAGSSTSTLPLKRRKTTTFERRPALNSSSRP